MQAETVKKMAPALRELRSAIVGAVFDGEDHINWTLPDYYAEDVIACLLSRGFIISAKDPDNGEVTFEVSW